MGDHEATSEKEFAPIAPFEYVKVGFAFGASALADKNVPEALLGDARPAGKLGDTYALQGSGLFYACCWR